MPKYQLNLDVPGVSADTIYEKVQIEIDQFFSKMGVGEFKFEYRPNDLEIDLDNKNFSGTLKCMNGKLSVEGKIGLLAVPFKSKIDEAVSKWISRTFA